GLVQPFRPTLSLWRARLRTTASQWLARAVFRNRFSERLRQTGETGHPPAAGNSRRFCGLMIASLIAVGVISAASLPDLPSVKSALTILLPPGPICPIRPELVFPFFLYCGLMSFCILAIVLAPRLPEASSDAALCVWLLGFTVGLATSTYWYLLAG